MMRRRGVVNKTEILWSKEPSPSTPWTICIRRHRAPNNLLKLCINDDAQSYSTKVCLKYV